jgi:hypothetical protein
MASIIALAIIATLTAVISVAGLFLIFFQDNNRCF